MPQPIVYVEMGALDVPRAASFYQYVFGWEFADPTQQQYSTFTSGSNGIGGGIYRSESLSPATSTVLYVFVDNIEIYCARVSEAGGQVVMPKSEVPGVGWYAHFKDPSGNVMGLFTPRQ